MAQPTIKTYLDRGLKAARTTRELAKALDMTEENAGKILKGALPGVDACLLLALLIDEPAQYVLRAARKDKMAALLDRLYGTAPERLSDAERDLLRMWRGIRSTDRAHVKAIIRRLARLDEDE